MKKMNTIEDYKIDLNIKAWCFGIGAVDATKYSVPLTAARGFLAVSDYSDGSYAAIFDTENNAKIARNILDFSGAKVSKNVIECYVNEDEIKAIKEKNKK